MSDPPSAPERPPRCPRCGYDQRGVMATWTESCPLESMCTECGFTYEWREVMDEDLHGPQWCVEFARRRRGVPLACVMTFFRSFRPWGFWARVRMAHPLRPWRLGMYVLSFAVPWLVAYLIVQTSVAVYVRYALADELFQKWRNLPVEIETLEQYLDSPQHRQNLERYDEETRAKVRRIELDLLAQMRAAQNGPAPRVEHPYVLAVIEALVFPTANDESWGEVRFASGDVGEYPPPASLYRCAGSFDATVSRAIGTAWLDDLSDLSGPAGEAVATFGLSIGVLLLLPTSFVLLPITRRRAKVRWAHFVRITVYSAWIPALTLYVCMALAVAAVASTNGAWGEWIPGVALGLPIVLAVPWWSAAVGRYLFIPRPLFTVLMLTVMCVLAMIVAAYYSDSLFDWWDVP